MNPVTVSATFHVGQFLEDIVGVATTRGDMSATFPTKLPPPPQGVHRSSLRLPQCYCLCHLQSIYGPLVGHSIAGCPHSCPSSRDERPLRNTRFPLFHYIGPQDRYLESALSCSRSCHSNNNLALYAPSMQQSATSAGPQQSYLVGSHIHTTHLMPGHHGLSPSNKTISGHPCHTREPLVP